MVVEVAVVVSVCSGSGGSGGRKVLGASFFGLAVDVDEAGFKALAHAVPPLHSTPLYNAHSALYYDHEPHTRNDLFRF